tara:strand:+ start:2441 stop:2917 length:477 start_codon:yes stop_codon:yes gene_type:complete
MCKKYEPALNATGVSIDDVIQEKDYLVYKSAMSYNPEKKVKFNTWLGNQVRYHCLNTINNNNNFIKVEDSVLDFLSIEENKDCSNDIEYVFSLLSQLKDDRIKEIFSLRYFKSDKKKMPWVKIGKIMGISTQTAINLHKRGLKILNKKISSTNNSDVI